LEILRQQELIHADRTKRVKEARDEAKKEIDEYKKAKDNEFKKFEAEVACLLSIEDLF
jgi:V-type H+-transporting ATPase subunit G